MNHCYIAIDGGTTNTRVNFVRGGEILETVRLPYGSNPHDHAHLHGACKEAIETLRARYGEPECVLGCGMLTSEYGLAEVPHLLSPAGIREFHNGIARLRLPQVSDLPVCLIPGIRIAGDSFLEVNIMRGEETELIGLTDSLSADCVYVLPGSHSKILRVDEQGRLFSLRSFLTGEMQAALAGHTILAGSVDIHQPFDDRYLAMGYDFAAQHGINEALLKVRTMDVVFHETPAARYSFFLGAILEGEILEIIRTPEQKVVIGGQPQLKDATCRLLARLCKKEVLPLSDDRSGSASVRGMIKIYEYKD